MGVLTAAFFASTGFATPVTDEALKSVKATLAASEQKLPEAEIDKLLGREVVARYEEKEKFVEAAKAVKVRGGRNRKKSMDAKKQAIEKAEKDLKEFVATAKEKSPFLVGLDLAVTEAQTKIDIKNAKETKAKGKRATKAKNKKVADLEIKLTKATEIAKDTLLSLAKSVAVKPSAASGELVAGGKAILDDLNPSLAGLVKMQTEWTKGTDAQKADLEKKFDDEKNRVLAEQSGAFEELEKHIVEVEKAYNALIEQYKKMKFGKEKIEFKKSQMDPLSNILKDLKKAKALLIKVDAKVETGPTKILTPEEQKKADEGAENKRTGSEDFKKVISKWNAASSVLNGKRWTYRGKTVVFMTANEIEAFMNAVIDKNGFIKPEAGAFIEIGNVGYGRDDVDKKAFDEYLKQIFNDRFVIKAAANEEKLALKGNMDLRVIGDLKTNLDNLKITHAAQPDFYKLTGVQFAQLTTLLSDIANGVVTDTTPAAQLVNVHIEGAAVADYSVKKIVAAVKGISKNFSSEASKKVITDYRTALEAYDANKVTDAVVAAAKGGLGAININFAAGVGNIFSQDSVQFNGGRLTQVALDAIVDAINGGKFDAAVEAESPVAFFKTLQTVVGGVANPITKLNLATHPWAVNVALAGSPLTAVGGPLSVIPVTPGAVENNANLLANSGHNAPIILAHIMRNMVVGHTAVGDNLLAVLFQAHLKEKPFKDALEKVQKARK